MMMLDGEGIGEGELLDALRRYAKGASGTYPPRPANLLDIVRQERLMRVRRKEMDGWRAAGCPTVDSDGTIHYNEIDTSEVTEVRMLPSIPTIQRLQ
jgi:hypothetical protein